ncbi:MULTISPECIES: hypothetical protein [Calothrix]|uniref:MotA/TolQ/ExbB proton channel domain-containing protein n=2 Tax=Calothrix TaxID=1186 RepID=A0ABR8AES8_9CYAN|nr:MULTISPECIES: hypothetical protein [Calothrix]MBD2197546.1 hypothetical protein [Calothrix parietina FACHB-288]MBD2226080.1 hypothetical protein [Calothrix anomala FACHB-343]
MGIAKIWDIIWDNGPFHWATAFVLIVAVIVEFYTVWQYCSKTQAAIKSLENPKNSRLQENSNVRRWKDRYLQTDTKGDFKKPDDKFLLIKYPSVLSRPIPRSSLRFVTTLCTAIGVLGTFYGIQDGLQGINLSSINNSSELMEASTGLLEGMKTAFSTSLMGLGSGSLFTLVLFISDSLKQKRRDSLRERLEKIATLPTTDNANAEVVQILSRVADTFTGLNHLSAEAIGQAVGQQMLTLILPGMKAIFTEQRQLRELQQNPGEKVLEELIKNLRIQVIEPIAVRLDKSAELTQQASNAVLTLHKELGGISQSLANSIQKMQDFQQDTLVKLEGFANNLGETLTQFQTDTKDVLQLTSQEINQAVQESIQGMTAQRSAFETSAQQAAATFKGIRQELEIALEKRAAVETDMLHTFANNLETTFSRLKTDTIDVLQLTSQEINRSVQESIQGMTAQRSAFETSAQQAAATFKGIREELETALENRAKVESEMLQDTQARISEILSEANTAFTKQTNNLKKVGDDASNLMNDARNNLLEALGNIDRTLTATRETVEHDLTKFREEYQGNLQEFFRQQNNLLEGTLGEHRDGLTSVVTNLDRVFKEEAERRIKLTEEVDRSMNKIQMSVEQIHKLVSAAGLHDAQRLIQLEKLAIGIGQQVQIVDNSYKNLNDKFDHSLESWRDHLENSMKQTVDLQESFFQKADEAMTKVCDRVLHTASVLLDANDNGNGRNHHG